MEVMTRAMPNLQRITIGELGGPYKWSDGEDPDERLVAARTADWRTYDIEIISNFSKLRILYISEGGLNPSWNGRYPFLFNSFPLLQKLSICRCGFLKWDLEILAGFPLLKELECWQNGLVTGNINSLRVLKDTLEKVNIYQCRLVEGNFMDLADFPRLKALHLLETNVTGDIRDIGENDFPSLEDLILPKGVYGGKGYEFQRISDGPDLVRAVYLIMKQRPTLAILNDLYGTPMRDWYARLSENSPDWYVSLDDDDDEWVWEDDDSSSSSAVKPSPPFRVKFIKAESRVGYRWEDEYGEPCEVNWLDPEPDRGSSDYEKYIEDLEKIDIGVDFYRGFHQPPTSDEYGRRWIERYGLA
jgi:hypothetical protein